MGYAKCFKVCTTRRVGPHHSPASLPSAYPGILFIGFDTKSDGCEYSKSKANLGSYTVSFLQMSVGQNRTGRIWKWKYGVASQISIEMGQVETDIFTVPSSTNI